MSNDQTPKPNAPEAFNWLLHRRSIEWYNEAIDMWMPFDINKQSLHPCVAYRLLPRVIGRRVTFDQWLEAYGGHESDEAIAFAREAWNESEYHARLDERASCIEAISDRKEVTL